MNNIPFFFNSFVKRKPFLDVCFYYYKKYFNNEIILTLDTEDYDGKGITILTYDNIPKTSDLLHECHSRYYRHYYTLEYFLSSGHEYFINCMDDGWIKKVDYDRFNQSLDILKRTGADRIDLCGPQPDYGLIPVEEGVSLVDKNNYLPWYLTNQCSLWKTESLIKVYKTLGPATDWEVEKLGSDVARNLDCRFLTFNTPVIDNMGLNQRKVGLSIEGKQLLEEYCNINSLNYTEELNKFNAFI